MHDSSHEQAASVVSVDMGNLMAFDPRPIDTAQLKNDADFVKNMTKLNVQLLLNQLFNLPVERVEDVIVAKLPKCLTVIPREKPLPKAKPPTKWEQYAKLKGIQKKKKSRMVYDETTKEYRPTWGYNRKDDSTKNWIYEIKKNEDPYQDFFSKATQSKNERVAKNELQRLRNIARTTPKSGGKVPGVGLQPLFSHEKKTDQSQIKKALHMAKRADASMSKFSEKLSNEDKVTKGLGKKRKFDANFNVPSEKERQFKILEKLGSTKERSTKAKLHIDKAANKHIATENYENKMNRKPKAGSGRGKKTKLVW